MFRRALTAFALVTALPAVALADETGGTGYVKALQVNQTSSLTYLQFHGRVFVGDNKDSTEYRWGGTSCGTRTQTEASVAMLMRALDGGLRIQPHYQIGQGQMLCLVGFTTLP